MKRIRWVSFACLVALLVLAGCSGSNTVQPPPPPGSSAVSVTMTDTPPMGVTILSFEVTVTGAALNPGNMDLLGGKTPRIEVEQLETESAFLSTANVTAGTYTSLNLTFANVELTFKNDTGAMLAGCNPGDICEIKPTGTLTSTFTFPGSGLTISANSPTGILIDVNPNVILSATLGVDFSQAGAVSAQQLPLPGQPPGQLEEIEDQFGKVANKGTNTFDLQLSQGTITGIQVDNNTQFEGFDTCSANPQNFTCVSNGDLVEVDLRLMAGGALVATKIEKENEEANEDELEGILVSTDLATQTFQMVVVEDFSALTTLDVGSAVTVHVQLGANFQVDNNGLDTSGFTFAAFTDLIVGQSVQIRRRSGDGSSATPIETDRVRLRRSQLTATVSSVASPDFVVNGLPPLFTANGITEITVKTSPDTDFENVSGVSGLNVNDTVSLRGPLFKNAGSPPATLVADKVRKR